MYNWNNTDTDAKTFPFNKVWKNDIPFFFLQHTNYQYFLHLNGNVKIFVPYHIFLYDAVIVRNFRFKSCRHLAFLEERTTTAIDNWTSSWYTEVNRKHIWHAWRKRIYSLNANMKCSGSDRGAHFINFLIKQIDSKFYDIKKKPTRYIGLCMTGLYWVWMYGVLLYRTPVEINNSLSTETSELLPHSV